MILIHDYDNDYDCNIKGGGERKKEDENMLAHTNYTHVHLTHTHTQIRRSQVG